jgi:hypothetical protein
MWMWLSMLAITGWMLTALAWWSKSPPSSPTEENPRNPHPHKGANYASSREAVKRACIANQPAQARQAILNWGRECGRTSR